MNTTPSLFCEAGLAAAGMSPPCSPASSVRVGTELQRIDRNRRPEDPVGARRARRDMVVQRGGNPSGSLLSGVPRLSSGNCPVTGRGDTVDPRFEWPVVVLTSCDRLTCEVRKALVGRVSMAFAESESALLQRVAQGAQLVVLHLNGAAGDGGVAGRLCAPCPILPHP